MEKIVEVVSYYAHWPEMFDAEAKRIKQALGPNCIEIHHIGSTSVPGLCAKPIIDILSVVNDILEVDGTIHKMELHGYEFKGENGIAFRRFFQKEAYHVHVFEKGDTEIDRHLKFRDWMRTHEEDARDYAKLKLELAAKYSQDRSRYSMGKDLFIASIDAKDGYQGCRMVQALTDREWAVVRALRMKNFFKSNTDPYSWTFKHEDHIHFVYYSNADIVGYAHIQLSPNGRAALRIIVIDESVRKHGFGSQLLNLCEQWLRQQGYKKLVVQSSKASLQFYCNHGYVEMPFEDPHGYKTDANDIEMGKNLS